MISTVLTGLILMNKRKMMDVFPPYLRKGWKEWELRGMAIFSLLLQIVLIVLGRHRRYIPGRWIRVVVWSAYLMADSVATIALGILTKDLGDMYDAGGKIEKNDELTAFWAPFFLLHLGGPDTITAYSLEDNELYLRHFFGVLVQTVVTIYIFLMAWTSSRLSYLYIPMIVVGSIKYGERTWALWKASSDELQYSMLSPPDHGPNYAKLMDEYCLRHAEGFHVEILEFKVKAEESAEQATAGQANIATADKRIQKFKRLVTAYKMFQKFKRLFADLILSYQEREESLSLFKSMTDHKEAFDVIAFELGFVYDLLYTKATVIYTAWGIFWRVTTFSLTCAVLVIFSFDDLGKYKTVDVVITFLLLGGAIFLEIYAAFSLLFSDQATRWLNMHNQTKISTVISHIKLFERPRWSGRMAQYSLLSICLNEKPGLLEKIGRIKLWEKSSLKKLLGKIGRIKLWEMIGLKKLLEEIGQKRKFKKHRYKYEEQVEEFNLSKMIFEHVSKIGKKEGPQPSKIGEKKGPQPSKIGEKKGPQPSLRDICNQRGMSTLERYEKHIHQNLLQWSVSCDFDESILIWHIATELCFYDKDNIDTLTKLIEQTQPQDNVDRLIIIGQSQCISRYMLYLLAFYPSMLPTGIGLIRLRDTRAETEKFFQERLSIPEKENKSNTSTDSSDAEQSTKLRKQVSWMLADKEKERASQMLLKVRTHVPPVKVKGDRSKSVLFDGCRLASTLSGIKDENIRWEMIRNMWLEMLTYAANQCRGKEHAHQLRRGGELLTHVWLLMAHFGMIEQFQISKGHARALLSTK